MKLGPLNINLASNKRPDTVEVGGSGTAIFSGILTDEEYNSDLTGSKGRKVYDKMRRSDGRVGAAIKACTLPIIQATHEIVSASEDRLDEEIAEHIRANLFGGMSITFESFLAQTLRMMLVFGFMPWEKIFEIRDDQKYYWKKFAPRLPKTVYKWNMKDGELSGIQQLVWIDESYEYKNIDIDYLLLFTHEREGNNYEGISLLRTAYQHWYYKSNYYRIDAIAAERDAMRLPVFKHPTNAKDADKDAIDTLGKRLYAHELNYIRLGEDYSFELMGGKGATKDIMKSIEHHDAQIGYSILETFMGNTETGSFAKSFIQRSLFLMNLKAIASNVTNTLNRWAIKQLVDLNYPNITKYPEYRITGLDSPDVEKYADAMSKLVSTGAITVDLDTENEMRSVVGLAEKKLSEEVKPAPKPAEPQDDEKSKGRQAMELKEWRRELKGAEKFVQFAEIDSRIDDAVEQMVKATAATKAKQIDKLVEVTSKIIAKRDIKRVEDIDIPYRSELATGIQSILRDQFKYGRGSVKSELSKQKKAIELVGEELIPLSVEGEAAIMAWLKGKAKASSNVMATRLKGAITFEALAQMRQGLLDEAALRKVMTDLSDREVRKTARMSVAEAFNLGRAAQAEKQRNEIRSCIYSAIIDPDNCPACAAHDGDEWDYDDPDTAKYADGNQDECEGGNNCRCLLVFVSKEESKAVK